MIINFLYMYQFFVFSLECLEAAITQILEFSMCLDMSIVGVGVLRF